MKRDFHIERDKISERGKISLFFQTYTDKFIAGLQSILLLALGIFMSFYSDPFVTLTSTLVLIAIALLSVIYLLAALFALHSQSKKEVFRRFCAGILLGCLAVFLSFPISHFMILLPIALASWALVLALIHLITFWQNRKESHSGKIRQLLYFILCFSFSLYIFLHLPQSQYTSLKILGIYLLSYAGCTLLDLLLSFTPIRIRNTIKRHIHIGLPVLFASFIPRSVLHGINRFFAQEGPTSLDVIKEASPKQNVEILIHVSDRSLLGAMGHIDLWLDGVYYSYGCYDESEMIWNGGIGPGTLFTHTEKEAYIRFCQESRKKALFGFGLALSEEQLAAMKQELARIMKDTYIWRPESQLVEEGKLPAKPYEEYDYASKLYLATHAKFYKFTKGSLKHYFVMSTNCVKLVDVLLRASGIGSVPNGIVAPGSYYDMLNQEFMREGSRVVSRKVYMSESNIAAGIEKEKNRAAENHAEETEVPPVSSQQ